MSINDIEKANTFVISFNGKRVSRVEQGNMSYIFDCTLKFLKKHAHICLQDPFSGAQDYTEEDCGPGCTLLRTKIDLGIVKCFGDGVDETLMFPDEMQCW